ncbi:hypothetical protein ERE_35480 [Agathobacter rectalis M104/1]|jgi:uncharacterized membrane protein|uniref:hypothetical protein n=1 Tax=Agathobacter rectalis TaxID=39491 RepID=UPI0001CD157B|nr:hypothetical protein [Agathobacter rectalis]CBK95284.1 hypothetical protein ERE_35480 [Agathobacter rectalis M104/1]
MTLSNVRIVQNDNRIMIIIDNPSQNDVDAVQEAFGAESAIKRLAGLKTPTEAEPQIPAPTQEVQPAQQDVPQQNVQNAPQQTVTQSTPEAARTPEMSAKELLADRTAQSALGLREVLWRLGTCLYPNTAREPFDAWFDRTSKEDHAAKYQEFATKIMAA